MTLYTGNIVTTLTVAIGASAVALDLSSVDGTPTGCRVSIEGGDVRVKVDGSSPTGAVGHLEPQDSTFTIVGSQNVRDLRMIAADGEAGATATVSVMVGGVL